jgi:thiosulfate/3-mercaptopyruvate sulfurtransferase
LKDALASGDVILLDATARLPGEQTDPEAAFLASRLPGARRFDIELFSDPEQSLPHMAPAAGRFARLAGELGLTRDSMIVVYDQGNIASSCRAWWLLRLFGHERVFILDGGLPAWREAEGQLEQGDPSPVVATQYVPRLTTALIKGLGDMLVLCSSDADDVILDARSAGRFTGEAPEPRAGLSSGHMPGARNIPFGELLDENRRFLPKAALRERFEKAGVETLQTPLIATCGSGMTASVIVVGAVLAGYGTVSLYDGSWAEWAATPDAPIVKGEASSDRERNGS